MSVIRVHRPDDPRLAPFAAVRDAELVRRHGQFIAEGRLVVRRVIGDSRFVLRSLMLNDAALAFLDADLARLDGDVPVYVCPTARFRQVTGYNIHRGCLALVERPRECAAGEVLGGSDVLVALENVANADNIGGVFRTAAALGARGILLSPACCDPFYRKAIRTSMGAVLQVPFARLPDWPAQLAEVKRLGFTLVALTPRRPSRPLDSFAASDASPRLALLVGAEGEGLSHDAESAADVRVHIPIDPRIDSLNLVVATGIALSRLVRLSSRQQD
jgi:tRNA G18 (ribose-2'-O)-methylase SpoU